MKEKKRSSSLITLVVILIIAVLSAIDIDAVGFELFAVLIPVVALVIVIGVFVGIFSQLAKQKKRQRPAPTVRTPKSSSQPPQEDPHCVMCENGHEDHMERDKRMRIAQLDDWLKSGLIDRAEYRVLKERYENS